MKTSTSILCILFGLFLVTSKTQAQSQQTTIENFLGTWEYTSQEAPNAYQDGQFLIAKKDEKTTVKVIFSNGKEIQAENVKMLDQQLQFDLYVENGYVSVQLERKKDDITGIADTTDGQIHLIAVKE